MAVRTWIGHFGISRGQAQEMGPFQGAFTRLRPGEPQVDLYVLAHPALPASEEFCGQIVAVVGRLFERQSLSLTGDLLKAIGAAHDNLRDWNRKSLREHQVGAGITCLVLRDTLAYLAQAGPSLAFYRSGSGFRRLVPEDPETTAVVGLADTLRPEIRRFELAPGDLLLLVSPTLSEIADDETIEELFAAGGEQILSELYLLTRDQEHFSAFLLVCFEEPEPQEPLPEDPPLAAAETVEDDGQTGTAAIAAPPGPAADEGETPAEEPTDVPKLSSSSAAAPLRPTTAPSRAAAPSVDYGSLARPRRLPIGNWLLAALATGVVAVALAWCLAAGGSDSAKDGAPSLLMRARQAYDSALMAPTLNEKRALLEEAQALLTDAQAAGEENAEAQGLRLDVSRALAEIDAVYELSDLKLLADLAPLGVEARALVAGGGALYVLDTKEGRVFRLPLSREALAPEVILKEGDFVGVVKAARPAHMVWQPDADGGKLLVLDEERNLFSFPPQQAAHPADLRDAGSWESVDGIACDGETLYVLDARGGHVWRYLPTQGGFDSERTAAVSATQLGGAAGIAAAGDIYLLMEDGTIRRFSEGEERPFPMDGLDTPLGSPPSLLASEQGLFVADADNKRIVQFTPDGRFQRQLVSARLGEPRAVAVDEVAGRLYVLDGAAVYESALPPLDDSAAQAEDGDSGGTGQ